MKGGGSAPTPPDPYATAQAQNYYNTYNQVTPYGSLTFTPPTVGGGGGAPQSGGGFTPNIPSSMGAAYGNSLGAIANGIQNSLGGQSPQGGGVPGSYGTATMTLNPEIQALLDSQIGVGQNALNLAGQRLDTLGQGTDAVERAMFERARGLLDPVFGQQEAGLRQSLADRGLPVGSEIFGDEFDVFNRGRNQAYTQAAWDSVMAGRQEQSRQYNELASLLGAQTTPIPQLGSFYGPSQTDFIGAQNNAYNGQMAQWQQGQQNRNAGLSGLFSLGSSFLLSDRDAKEDIVAIGSVNGLTLYQYRYIGSDEPHIGFMADEVAKVRPDAVVRGADGFDRVDYWKVLH